MNSFTKKDKKIKKDKKDKKTKKRGPLGSLDYVTTIQTTKKGPLGPLITLRYDNKKLKKTNQNPINCNDIHFVFNNCECDKYKLQN